MRLSGVSTTLGSIRSKFSIQNLNCQFHYHVGERVDRQVEAMESQAFLVVVAGDQDHVVLEDFEPLCLFDGTGVSLLEVDFELFPFFVPSESV